MTLITFIQLFIVCLLGAMSPGPSMIVVINNAVFKNRFHGYLTSIGHGLGILIYAILAILGLGYLIDNYPFIFNLFHFLSSLILIYLGLKTFLSQKKIEINKDTIKHKNISFLQGFGISFFNPKIFIWFIVIYSQFMLPNTTMIYDLILIITAGVVDMGWYIFLTIIVTTSSALKFINRQIHIFKKLIGVIFMFLGSVLFMKLLVIFS